MVRFMMAVAFTFGKGDSTMSEPIADPVDSRLWLMADDHKTAKEQLLAAAVAAHPLLAV